ncbi:ParB/RepB/Spo0J family partition protein [Lyngbya sp. CCY1209]|uniref:ParB/RepB/Spo0J family partition protein n=1 Tax=Lyngbya sp. CCY1209 TaxID=2886103 RepID=UPI002D217E8F|nr:ParB/RepB/Spo0J family partition protein [Lyngbya sp. CCY1209]MEB3884608.1 ParB/RepB/Spo0J family partition protein [Lyngbya sp. CCY1209]
MNSHDTPNSDGFEVVRQLSLEQIFRSPLQPRAYFSPKKMQEMIASIRQNGIIHAITVRPAATNRYELVTGERRYQAAQQLGFRTIPAIVKEMSDAEALQYALTENLEREELNPVEETEGIVRLLELKLETDRQSVISMIYKICNHKRKLTNNIVRKQDRDVIFSVFASVGSFSLESFRVHRLGVLNLPEEVLEAIRKGRIEYTKGKELGKVKDPELRRSLLEEAIALSLSVKKIRRRIKALQVATKEEELQTRIEAIPRKAKKLKVWDDPEVGKQIEALLVEMERLLDRTA